MRRATRPQLLVRLISMKQTLVCVCVRAWMCGVTSLYHSSGFADKRMSIQLFKWPHKTSELIASPYTYRYPHKICNNFQATDGLSLNDWCWWDFKKTECNACRFNLLYVLLKKLMQTLLRRCRLFYDNAESLATMKTLLRQCRLLCDNVDSFVTMQTLWRQCRLFCDDADSLATMQTILRQWRLFCDNAGSFVTM
jgi:hypothetical protein